jgi:hypothetical protein
MVLETANGRDAAHSGALLPSPAGGVTLSSSFETGLCAEHHLRGRRRLLLAPAAVRDGAATINAPAKGAMLRRGRRDVRGVM